MMCCMGMSVTHFKRVTCLCSMKFSMPCKCKLVTHTKRSRKRIAHPASSTKVHHVLSKHSRLFLNLCHGPHRLLEHVPHKVV